MSRSQRLLSLIQLLRRQRQAITGSQLAQELGVSLRTLYRDIATLQEQGANIEGEPGQGYVLKPGFMLPPLMFSEEEIEALVLGSRWVVDRGDRRLSEAAHSAREKIAAVLPDGLRKSLDDSGLLIAPQRRPDSADIDLHTVREAIRSERKLKIHYTDLKGNETTRIVWPFALGYFETFRILVAWCESRDGFRHFRTERISQFEVLDQTYPRPRQTLLSAWGKDQKSSGSNKVTTDRN